VGIPIDRSRVEYKWWSTSENIPVMEAVVTKNTTGSGSTFALHYRDSYKVIVNPNGPQVAFNVADTNVFINSDSILFNNTTTNGQTYNWTITPATYSFAAKTTRTSKNPQVIFHAAGLYTVSLTATNLAGSNSITKRNYINATHNSGIAPISENHGLSIYPNPTNGDLYLHFDSSFDNNNAIVQVINIFGQTIFQKIVFSGQTDTKINMNGFAAGVYFVKCQVGGERFVEKVLVR
jgi:PKD repeat protein